MQTITAILSDDTTVNLRETLGDEEGSYAILLNGRVECCYFDFDFAWQDFGKTVLCATLNDARGIAYA